MTRVVLKGLAARPLRTLLSALAIVQWNVFRPENTVSAYFSALARMDATKVAVFLYAVPVVALVGLLFLRAAPIPFGIGDLVKRSTIALRASSAPST